MTQPAKAQEPSMEEILASIRRIIADDDASKTQAKAPEPAKPAAAPRPAPAVSPPPPAPPRPPAAAKPAAPPPRAPVPAPAPSSIIQDDIDSMFANPEPQPNGGAKPAQNDILELTEAMEAPKESAPEFRHIDGQQDVTFSDPPPAPQPAPMIEEARRQFQQHTGAARSLLSASTTAAVDSAFNSLADTVLVQNSRTLDDLAREMLRPMLKAWLDDNLPTLVERMVRAEIERVSRGR